MNTTVEAAKYPTLSRAPATALGGLGYEISQPYSMHTDVPGRVVIPINANDITIRGNFLVGKNRVFSSTDIAPVPHTSINIILNLCVFAISSPAPKQPTIPNTTYIFPHIDV